METDVYRALRTRINLFTAVVGRLQPILSTMPQIAAVALIGPEDRHRARANLVSDLAREAAAPARDAFDIDDAINAALEMPERPAAPYGLEELGRLLDRPELLPPGCEAQRVSSKDVFWLQPGAPKVAVTTDPAFFEEHGDSLEFWTPGSPAFPTPDSSEESTNEPTRLGELLDSSRARQYDAAMTALRGKLVVGRRLTRDERNER